MNIARPSPTTQSVLSVWCTTTLSITTCVKIGAARPASWIASEASSTSRQMRLWRSSSGTNHLKPKAWGFAAAASGSLAGAASRRRSRTTGSKDS